MQPYKPSWFSERQGAYDPHFLTSTPEPLAEEGGPALAMKDTLKPTAALNRDIPATKEAGLMWRGMSHEEHEHFRKTGEIRSHGSHNIGPHQKGLTYFADDPRDAAHYADGFAPNQLKPSPGRHAYVVEARMPEPSAITHVHGTGENEIGVNRPITRGEVTNVYRGRVVAHDPGETKPSGGGVSRSSWLHWEPLGPPREGRAEGGGFPHATKPLLFHSNLHHQHLHTGPIHSHVSGRTDHLPMHVPSGSYVLPADVVSAHGEGNTMAGFKVMHRLFGGAPYGHKGGPYGQGGGPYGEALQNARGGRAVGDDRGVPIVAAGGEYVLSPDQVRAVGKGDPKVGCAVLDEFVKRSRAKNIKTLQKLPGPAKD